MSFTSRQDEFAERVAKYIRIGAALIFLVLAISFRQQVWDCIFYLWIALLAGSGLVIDQRASLDWRSYTPSQAAITATVLAITAFLAVMALAM